MSRCSRGAQSSSVISFEHVFVRTNSQNYHVTLLTKKHNVSNMCARVCSHCRSVNGFQMLYAYTYRSYDEFRKMFDHTHYDKMRTQYGGKNAFPEIYDKVKMRNFSLEKYLEEKKKIKSE